MSRALFGDTPPAVVVEVDELAEYRALDEKVDAAEGEGIVARWEFGQRLLLERAAHGGKQLPHGRLDEICEAISKSKAEVSNRIQFAEQYPTKEKVSNALETFSSWYEICSQGLGTRAGAHVSNNSGDNEWYTPADYIESAVAVMGGIDLDPASSVLANEIVGARIFFTEADNGLTKPWAGRVWMNPPYESGLVDKFCARLSSFYKAGDVKEACVLVNNATETGWFHALGIVASAVCFPKGRVKFWNPEKESASPLQGQAVLYLGPNRDTFRDEFKRFGLIGFRVQV